MGRKRIILIVGDTETLGYFSKELAIYLQMLGREVFIWDVKHPADSVSAFEELPDKADSVLVTFNFIGLSGEGQFGDEKSTIWEEHGIDIINIMVDSPVYYYKLLKRGFKRFSVACIDRNHVAFVKRWYPEIENVYFWPLNGNEPVDDLWLRPGIYDHSMYKNRFRYLPFDERPVDIVFTANYVTKASIDSAIDGMDAEYKSFLMDICDQMIRHPEVVLEDTLYENLLREFPDEPEESYPEAMYHMVYVDLYVRSYFRALAVKTLVDAGYRVHCVGKDWDNLVCDHPENLIHTDAMLTSADCVRALESARISLNVMPLFKAGAHDRVFTSMMAGCVALTDSSSYLDELITPWVDYAPFVPWEPESLTDASGRLMADPALAEKLADQGRKSADGRFTWLNTANFIDSMV